ncbi:MAG: hypothetical protein ACYC4B_24610 [Pirellulaceae bacterium]
MQNPYEPPCLPSVVSHNGKWGPPLSWLAYIALHFIVVLASYAFRDLQSRGELNGIGTVASLAFIEEALAVLFLPTSIISGVAIVRAWRGRPPYMGAAILDALLVCVHIPFLLLGVM